MKLLLTGTAVAIAGLLVAAPASVSASSTHTSSPSCTSLQTKANKASKAGKTKRAKKLKKQSRACQQNLARELSVVKEISGYTFTGTRGDGLSMNLTFCPNGQWISYERDPRYANTGSSWYVRSLAYSSATRWVTQVGENMDRDQGGFGIGLARNGNSYQVGIASFDTVTDLGPATRTSGAAICAELG
jgi:hypothetical protein